MLPIEAVRTELRRIHDSPRTEEAYVHWIRAFIRFHQRRHPHALLRDRHVSASTHNQAICAHVFLYKRVLKIDLPALDGLQRAQRPAHLPEVISPIGR